MLFDLLRVHVAGIVMLIGTREKYGSLREKGIAKKRLKKTEIPVRTFTNFSSSRTALLVSLTSRSFPEFPSDLPSCRWSVYFCHAKRLPEATPLQHHENLASSPCSGREKNS
jgi:hypothetical protein